MRGLLLKDLALLKNQAQALLLVAAISVFMMAMGNDIVFIISYTVMIFAMYSISTLSYDYFDNGYAFLFTLPITRKLYVLEKYVFSFLCVLAGCTFSLILMIGQSLILSQNTVVFSDDISFLVGYIFGAMISLSAVLPLQIKFGPEKGRIAMLVFFMIIMAAGIALKDVLDDEKVVQLLEKVSDLAPMIALGMLGIFSIALFGISYLISCKIMKKKEF